MQFTAAQIALMINGIVEGNADITVASFGKIEEAKTGQLTFLANPKYEEFLYNTAASIIIVNETQVLRQPIQATLIKVPDAYSAFATLLNKYQQIKKEQLVGIQQPAYIAASAKIGDHVYIGAFAYIGENVIIADDVKIYPNAYIGDNVTIDKGSVIFAGVKIYNECIIGSRVNIHAGAVVGSDGFGFAPQSDGTLIKVPQLGNVVIENDVEVGANTTIDRGTIGSTIIRTGVKLDNLVQIAHNVEIGNHTVVAALAGISGSTKIGSNVMIGGQAGIAGHLKIADGCKINAQSGLGKNLKKEGSSVTGSPAYEYSVAIRSQATARNLPEFEKRLLSLEKQIQELLLKK